MMEKVVQDTHAAQRYRSMETSSFVTFKMSLLINKPLER